jgi:pimeloyl-ACP methyl ester carboxylesterase
MSSSTGPQTVRVLGHGGVWLSGDVFPDGSGPFIVFFHGGGQTRHAWRETAEVLSAAGFRVASFDLRGHGESDWSEAGDYSLSAFAADVKAVADHLGDAPLLVGASLGGLSSLLAAAELGVGSALVLVDVAPRLEPQGVERIVGFMKAHPEGFATVEEAADSIAAYLPHRTRPTELSGLSKNLRQGADGRLRWHWDPRFLAGPSPNNATSNLDRLTSAARKITVPSLLVRGKRSDLLTPEGAAEFLTLVPHARFVDVAEAGHMVAGDRNDAFTRAILPFLHEVTGRAPAAASALSHAAQFTGSIDAAVVTPAPQNERPPGTPVSGIFVPFPVERSIERRSPLSLNP